MHPIAIDPAAKAKFEASLQHDIGGPYANCEFEGVVVACWQSTRQAHRPMTYMEVCIATTAGVTVWGQFHNFDGKPIPPFRKGDRVVLDKRQWCSLRSSTSVFRSRRKDRRFTGRIVRSA